MHIQATWLGQAGLLLEFDALRVMIDPYLSDSIAQIDPQKHRRTAVDPAVWDVRPDMMIFTHDHRDHYDEETARPSATSPRSRTSPRRRFSCAATAHASSRARSSSWTAA